MPIMYYGSKISDNITKTPEGYLICRNVPIGRTGWMDYSGEEIGVEELRGKRIKVKRNPEELFSPVTMASFEGKPVTNEHPTKLLTLDTVSTQERGHMQNIRRDGDFLLGDLFVTDAGLIAEIENGKRDVSSGYDAMWVPLDDAGDEWEQKNIIGNHVAVVTSGRAGHKVSIQDAAPPNEAINKFNNKNKESEVKPMKLSKKGLIGKMIKAFAQDAEPEELAEAMDAFGGNQEQEAPAPEQQKEDSVLEKIMAAIQGIDDRLTRLEQSDKKVHEEVGAGAEDEFAGLEKELDGEVKDAEAGSGESEVIEPEEKKEECMDAEENEPPKAAMDSAFRQFVADMKPAIMGIQDEKTRLATAKQFKKAVNDLRSHGSDGYAAIVDVMQGHKRQAMDKATSAQTESLTTLADKQAQAWNQARESYKGGN